MPEKENEKSLARLEESKNKTDDDSGDDGGFGAKVLELTKKINKSNCLELN